MSISNLFYPKGVAVIGSTSEGKIGYELIRQILDGGYQEVFAVNPKGQGVFSVPGYNTVSQIDHPVDLAVIVSPTTTVPGVLEDCGQAGVKAAVIITAGFSEVGNAEGEAEVKRVADEHGIRFVGPNCAGIVNTGHHLFPTLETRPPSGQVSIVAQSGAVGGVVLAWAKEYGLGISKFVSYGNKADLNEIDCLRYLIDDPETKVVGLYIESVTDGQEFMQVVQECTRHKPVIVIKAGSTQSGQRATLSHTGSMAGADAVYDAALRQCGAIRVQTIEEMFDLCKGFLYVPRLQGRRVAIVTNSGGPGVLAADQAEKVGLDVVEPSPVLKEKLSEFLPAHCALKNPIDLTVEGTEAGYRETLLTVLQEYDVALALNIATPYIDSVPLARGTCDAAAQSGKPVVASFLPGQIVTDGVVYLQERDIPNFNTGERAVTALARMAAYSESANRRTSESANLRVDESPSRLPGKGQMLEPEAMTWLRQNGIPVPDFYFAKTPAEVTQGCHEIGYPVAIKVVSPDILHKSDYGGVILNVQDEQAALTAFEKLQQAALSNDKDFRGVVIYPMIRGAQEVLLGLSRDPQFGPVVAFGLGGIYTEIWHDISLRVAPVDHNEAKSMIQEIKSARLLQGVRGQAPCDLDALADVLANFSRLPFLYPEIDEVDLNPVFLLSEGLMVGDVRVIRKKTSLGS
ncbi:MAG: acetate--CoA ligase family protein [Chloroflexi bacterium]|nr:acetate--CoA ligase family protein [Chloroflexota bacterium]